jgi:hypothetical protein
VTKLGLLTKRGMDWFPQVYDEFYADPTSKPDFDFSPGLKKVIGDDVVEEAKYAIRIVGVFDTVEFHGEGWGGEKIEFHNAELSNKIEYAYHALSLDERRIPYTPTLFQWPRDTDDKHKLYQPKRGIGLQVMKQVWFSGTHGDIGGGRFDTGGSDITLAWMLAQCSKDKKLAFIDEDSDKPDDFYLLPDRGTPNPNTDWVRLNDKLAPEPKEGIISSITTKMQELAVEDRKAWLHKNTFERIHRSIRDRDFHHWPCGMLTGKNQGQLWSLAAKDSPYGDKLPELEPDAEADPIEDKYRNRIRALPGNKGGPPMKVPQPPGYHPQ